MKLADWKCVPGCGVAGNKLPDLLVKQRSETVFIGLEPISGIFDGAIYSRYRDADGMSDGTTQQIIGFKSSQMTIPFYTVLFSLPP
jgi:hypothetical protein